MDYTRIAPLYDRIFNRPLEEGNNLIAELLRERVLPERKLKVLEVGIGSGFTLEKLPTHVDYTGVDVNKAMLSLARTRAEHRNLTSVHLKVMDAMNLEFSDSQFDLVLAPSVLSAMDEPSRALREMERILRPGGEIVIIMNLRKRGSLRSSLVKALGPITRNFLGYRVDLYLEDLQVPGNLELIERNDINKYLGFSLSSYLVFKKVES